MNLKLFIVCFAIAIGVKVCLDSIIGSIIEFLFQKFSTSEFLNNRIIMTQFRFQILGISDVVIPFVMILKAPIMKI